MFFGELNDPFEFHHQYLNLVVIREEKGAQTQVTESDSKMIRKWGPGSLLSQF